jgi:hypothetical protein
MDHYDTQGHGDKEQDHDQAIAIPSKVPEDFRDLVHSLQLIDELRVKLE